MVGCSSEAESPDKSEQDSYTPETTHQTQLIKGADLGDSVDMSETTGQRDKTNSCVGVEEYEIKNVGDWDAKAFYTYNMEDGLGPQMQGLEENEGQRQVLRLRPE